MIFLSFPSCASNPGIQPQINSLVVAEKFRSASKILEEQKKAYGKNNELLYLLDKGLVLHFAQRYEESIDVFDKAKLKFDELYTKSVTNFASTWFVNDYRAPFRGEDFERVMINIFQALNFATQGNIEEALVEARDVDSVLSAINQQYDPGQKNVYKEDAFVRLFMGLLYETNGTNQDLNDAYISYVKADQVYEDDYQRRYGFMMPQILKENLLAAAQWMGPDEFKTYRDKFAHIKFLSIEEKKRKAEIIFIHYQGLSPIKHQDSIFIALPGGYVAKIAFPRYDKRVYEDTTKNFTARNTKGQTFKEETQLGEDITAIAIKNLENHRARVIAKAVARPLGKYVVERKAEGDIQNKYGKTSSDWFRAMSSVYNVFSEQADLRSWQTLPGEIRIARLLLEPGDYELFLEQKYLGNIRIKAGDKRFFMIRAAR